VSAVGEAWRDARTPALAPVAKVRVHYRIEGGKFLTATNAFRIVARSLRPQTGHFGMAEDYRETWVIKPDRKKGYHFVEITHCGGICGYAPTVRLLVLRSGFGLFGPNVDREIVIVPADEALKLHGICDQHQRLRDEQDALWRSRESNWRARRAA
jgi:hypothetical protein